MIYLDYAAHAPADPAVLERFCDMERRFTANPNSGHAAGRAAREQMACAAEQIAPLEKNLALGHLKALVARQHRGQRALARAVRPHDRMDLAGTHRQIDSLQYLLAVDSGMQIFHFQHSIYLMRPARLALARKPEAR